MTIKEQAALLYAFSIVGGVVAMGLAAQHRNPLPLLAWLAIFGLASFFIRCPKCGKTVFFTERRRTMGFSIGHTRVWPERVCSRCGTKLDENTDQSASSLPQETSSMTIEVGDSDVLLVIDVQNDFCPGGNLAVPEGDEVVPVINALAQHFDHVVLTQDWHPAGHHSFASSHAGRQPLETVEFAYGPQILWPDHCVQGTRGAELRADLDIPHSALVIRKGFRPHIDSYSAFYENDRKTPTGLAGYLRERDLKRLFVAGLALDFCVRYSAEDARREGFEVVVVEDACRGIDVGGSVKATRESFAALGVATTRADLVG
jgi:nicotinamidase/pyrazinamidase